MPNNVQGIIDAMRQKSRDTAEQIKEAAPKREPVARRSLEYTIQVLGSIKRGGAFGHKDR